MKPGHLSDIPVHGSHCNVLTKQWTFSTEIAIDPHQYIILQLVFMPDWQAEKPLTVLRYQLWSLPCCCSTFANPSTFVLCCPSISEPTISCSDSVLPLHLCSWLHLHSESNSLWAWPYSNNSLIDLVWYLMNRLLEFLEVNFWTPWTRLKPFWLVCIL